MKKIISLFVFAVIGALILQSCVKQNKHCKAAHKRKDSINKIQFQ